MVVWVKEEYCPAQHFISVSGSIDQQKKRVLKEVRGLVTWARFGAHVNAYLCFGRALECAKADLLVIFIICIIPTILVFRWLGIHTNISFSHLHSLILHCEFVS